MRSWMLQKRTLPRCNKAPSRQSHTTFTTPAQSGAHHTLKRRKHNRKKTVFPMHSQTKHLAHPLINRHSLARCDTIVKVTVRRQTTDGQRAQSGNHAKITAFLVSKCLKCRAWSRTHHYRNHTIGREAASMCCFASPPQTFQQSLDQLRPCSATSI